MKNTKIIATVGPACRNPKTLETLIREGVDVFRINASHSTPEDMASWFRLIRSNAKLMGRHVAVLVDLQGPRIRTGKIRNGPFILKTGEEAALYVRSNDIPSDELAVNCAQFTQMIKKADKILIDNGTIELRVKKIEKNRVICEVIRGGSVGDNKGINLPNAPVTLPALTKKDLKDLKKASDLQADYIALSFVRSSHDILTIRSWMKKNHVRIPIIAKIEKPRAVKNLDSILPLVDGVMVARGDLGIEMGIEKVPGVQKMIIERAQKFQVPVITATQMLETMIDHSHPTRAEVSDIANAVFDGTDAVMLSGETSIGKYPVEAVKTMRTIIDEAEVEREEPSPSESGEEGLLSARLQAIAHAGRNAAHQARAQAIIIFTHTGRIARHLSKLKPGCMLVAATSSERTLARMSLLKGVRPIYTKKCRTFHEMSEMTDRAVIREGLLKKGDLVILISGPWAFPGSLFMLAIHRVGDRASHLS